MSIFDEERISKQLRDQAVKDTFRVTAHAHQEMVEENVLLDDVIDVLRGATLLENYPEHKGCMLFGRGENPFRSFSPCCMHNIVIGSSYYYGLRTHGAKMGYTLPEGMKVMNCNIRGCPGHYEKRMIVHTVKRGCELLVFENVPADVCDVCSDTLLAPQTIRHLESIMRHPGKPTAQAPVFAYA